MLDKFAVAKALRDIAALLELKDANPYKVKAYRQGAHVLEITDFDVEQLYRENRLTEIRGIGSALAGIIDELYRTGGSKLLAELQAELPNGVLEFAGIEGLTLKRIMLLQELGIKNKDELLKACENNHLANTHGLGVSLQKKILQSVISATGSKRIILAKAINIADTLVNYMRAHTLNIEVAGQVRRWQEIVDKIELVASTDNLERTKSHFQRYSSFVKSTWLDEGMAIGHLANGLEVIMIATDANNFYFRLHEYTGTPAHISHLQLIADQLNKSLYDHKLDINRDAEDGIYSNLHLPYIIPELREDWGEIEAAQSGDDFTDLIELDDIQGMVHCHSTYSDGGNTIEEMALAAQEMGYSYITITDHSPTAFYANGLNIDRLKEQWEEIERVQENVKIRILRGTESDIIASGQLDYPDNVLEKFDVIIGSIHSRYKMDEDKMTERIKTCMRLPVFKIWGHALGRLLLRREPVPCRVEEVLDIIAVSRAAIEINGDPHRMDLEPLWLKEAQKRRIKFVISTDAHSTSDLYNLPFGVHMARRAGLRKADILNTLPYREFKESVRPVAKAL